jgi:hypothetical protein
MSTPIWLDNNILVGVDNGTMPFAEREILNLQKDGFKPLIPASVEREFLHGPGFNPADTVRRQAILERLGVEVDTMANRVPMNQLMAWREQGMLHGLSIPDADIIAQVKAGAQARGIRNPVFLTRDAGGTLKAMRGRGVSALEFKTGMPKPTPSIPEPPIPEPSIPKPVMPDVPVGPTRSAAIKAGIKAGLKDVLSAENIAAMIPDLFLVFADRMAAREASRKIVDKFIKEGFAKGFAAGLMGWTEHEVQLNLKNHVTSYRVQGMEDPAGILPRAYILRIAEAYENYAVDVGYQFSSSKSLSWKAGMREKGFKVLREHGYHFGKDPAALFEYEFIDKLAWELRHTTNAIVEPAIRR